MGLHYDVIADTNTVVVDDAVVVTVAEDVTNTCANDADEFVMTWSHLFSGMSYATPGSG